MLSFAVICSRLQRSKLCHFWKTTQLKISHTNKNKTKWTVGYLVLTHQITTSAHLRHTICLFAKVHSTILSLQSKVVITIVKDFVAHKSDLGVPVCQRHGVPVVSSNLSTEMFLFNKDTHICANRSRVCMNVDMNMFTCVNECECVCVWIRIRINFIAVRTQRSYVTHKGLYNNKQWHNRVMCVHVCVHVCVCMNVKVFVYVCLSLSAVRNVTIRNYIKLEKKKERDAGTQRKTKKGSSPTTTDDNIIWLWH